VSQPAVAITGRFQPFHLDHLDLVKQGLAYGGAVVIGITNPDHRSLKAVSSSAHRHKSNANPFTFWERQQIISAVMKAFGVAADRFRIVPFPLDEPSTWFGYIPQATQQLVRAYSDWEAAKAAALRDGGYIVELIEGDPARKISATEVRAAMAVGEPWQHWVPEAAVEILQAYGEDVLRERCA
jgi:nicotinamide mononucleotide adenylyltransferase